MEQCAWHSGIEERIHTVCVKIDAQEKVISAQLKAQKDALDLARIEMDRRLEGLNRFKQQISELTGAFATWKEVNLQFAKLEDKLSFQFEKVDEKNKLTLDPIKARVEKIEKTGVREEGAYSIKTIVASSVIAVLTFLVAHWLLKF